MKIKNLIYLLTLLFFASCEEVIDVDLNAAEPRLVIDAAIKWEKGTDGSLQTIRLTTTAAYFDDEVPAVSDAIVTITNSQNTVFTFVEFENTGYYECDNFIPVLNESYTLTVISDGETYNATEILKPVPVIDAITQTADGGFTGDNPEVKIFFTDNGATDDFYLFSYLSPADPYPSYEVLEDRLIQGNQSFSSYSDEDLDSGDVTSLYIAGISERYYNYMRILLSISGGGGGGPFQSPPATVRGNIVNPTNIENYALGYFSASEIDYRSVIIE